jgi:hypothetical protein
VLALVVDLPVAAALTEYAGTTNGHGVDVALVRHQDGSARAWSPASSCEWHAVPAGRVQEFTEVPRPALGERDEGDELYVVWCGNGAARYAWLGSANFVDPVGPLVEDLLARVEVLQSGIQVRPDSRGITGIPSMFWVEGPGAAPASEIVSAFGLTVTVSFALVGVEWDFGDGTPRVSGGLGEAYPQRSSIQHTYKDASPNDVPYRVTAILTFQPSYTVSDGSTTTAGEALAPIQVPITRDYLVHQIQAIRKR